MVTSWDDRAVEVEVPINIALVKYWGKRDENLIIPINNSLSLNIDEVFARTRVRCSCRIAADSVMINDSVMNLEEKKNRRFPKFFDYARSLIKKHKLGAESGDKSEAVCRFEVCSTTNFPVGAGLASSAAGFAAIAFAIGTMFRIPAEEVSRLARRGNTVTWQPQRFCIVC
ncbi:unnamed protein product [Heligmosomoides polygyrus]|uniref:GHMP_kinases_N domain-containing protein n=1 Tax=Heligmosomoides polygyrus TaxID=6339 RepID=A0A183G148_HELPZ|nr:unnamed protein product [Heligmosomoides polygyrus]